MSAVADYMYRGEAICHTCLEHLMGEEWIAQEIGKSVTEIDRVDTCDQAGCEDVVKTETTTETWDLATHRITFTPVKGAPQRTLVRLDAVGGAYGPAYTEIEWSSAEAADWEYTTEGWIFHGQPTPGGANGTVYVEKI